MSGLPGAFAGRRRRSKAKGGIERVEVPVEEVRAEWRPNWPRARDFEPMEEDAPGVGLLARVVDAIKLRPALSYLHLSIALGNNSGYPDIHVYGPGGMAWWELKGSAGRVYVHQVTEIERIRLAGGEARFIWPEDYLIGVVDDVLDRLAGDPLEQLRGDPCGAGPPGGRAGLVSALHRSLEPGKRFCGCPIEGNHLPTCPTWGRGRDGIRR